MTEFLLKLTENIQTFNIILGLGIMIAYFTIDTLYVKYTIAITERHPLRAATTGCLIHLLLAIGVINYVDNFLYIIPIMLGSWLGTYSALKLSRTRPALVPDTHLVR